MHERVAPAGIPSDIATTAALVIAPLFSPPVACGAARNAAVVAQGVFLRPIRAAPVS